MEWPRRAEVDGWRPALASLRRRTERFADAADRLAVLSPAAFHEMARLARASITLVPSVSMA